MRAPASAAAPRPIERGRIADQILEDLRDQIARGLLPRGSRLPAERALAERYGVSGATIREAIRGLTAMGFVAVRHGSGAYVTAVRDHLVANSLGALIQLEEVSIADILGILSVLNLHAAALAAEHATRSDIAALDGAIDALAKARNVETLVAALRGFLGGLAAAAHNPLLAALCNFLAELQIELALELSGRSYERWRKTTAALQTERVAIVAALRKHDVRAAQSAVKAYQDGAMTLIKRLPYGRQKRIPSTPLAGALSVMLRRALA